jgi:hypothetical protein
LVATARAAFIVCSWSPGHPLLAIIVLPSRAALLKHDPETCEAVFRNDPCLNNELKREDDSSKSRCALERFLSKAVRVACGASGSRSIEADMFCRIGCAAAKEVREEV